MTNDERLTDRQLRETATAMGMPKPHAESLLRQAFSGDASARFVIAAARVRLNRGECSVCRRDQIGAYHTHACE